MNSARGSFGGPYDEQSRANCSRDYKVQTIESTKPKKNSPDDETQVQNPKRSQFSTTPHTPIHGLTRYNTQNSAYWVPIKSQLPFPEPRPLKSPPNPVASNLPTTDHKPFQYPRNPKIPSESSKILIRKNVPKSSRRKIN
jgi:hypothetical protein